MQRWTKRLWVPLVTAALCLPAARARQQQQTPPPTSPVGPVQPVAGQGDSQTGASGQGPASPVVGPPTTVTGGFAPSASESGDTHSQISAGVSLSELFDSNFQNSTASSGFSDITNFTGHFDLHRLGANSDFLLHYSGGGYIDAQDSSLDGSYHTLGISQTIQFRRWSLKLDDEFSYLPESSFGGAGVAGSSVAGISLVNPDVPPSQGILTPLARRISNTLLAEASAQTSARTTWTLTGSYGILDYIDPGYLNSADYNFGVGYNYALSARDVIGVSYQFNAIRFSPVSALINDNTVLITYGHHITGRLVFQAGIGPQVNDYVPASGPSLGNTLLFSANAGLSYQYSNQTSLSGSFSHGVAGGSGLLVGATTDALQFSASHALGPWWSVNGIFGYSLNQSLPQAETTASSYNVLYAGGGISRILNRSASVFVNYNLSRQTDTNVVCSGTACAVPFFTNMVSVGFSWNMRPIPIN